MQGTKSLSGENRVSSKADDAVIDCRNLWKIFGLPSSFPTDEKHYLYELGTAIRPPKEVRTIDTIQGYRQIRQANRCECVL